jgi:hypothetical protein
VTACKVMPKLFLEKLIVGEADLCSRFVCFVSCFPCTRLRHFDSPQ